MTDKVSWTTVFHKKDYPLGFAESVELIADDMKKGMRVLEPARDHVGCLLSGRVDSSMLYKLAKDVLSLNESHSTGYPFEDPAFTDERMYAEAAAETFGSHHHYHAFSTNQFLHALIDAVDQCRNTGDTSAVSIAGTCLRSGTWFEESNHTERTGSGRDHWHHDDVYVPQISPACAFAFCTAHGDSGTNAG